MLNGDAIRRKKARAKVVEAMVEASGVQVTKVRGETDGRPLRRKMPKFEPRVCPECGSRRRTHNRGCSLSGRMDLKARRVE